MVPLPAVIAASTNSRSGWVKSSRSAQHYIGVGNTTTDGDLQSTTHTRDKHSGRRFGATSLIAAAVLEAQFTQPGPTCQSRYPLAQVSNCDCAKRRNLYRVPFRDDRRNPFYAAFHNRGPLRHIVHVSFSFRYRQPTNRTFRVSLAIQKIRKLDSGLRSSRASLIATPASRGKRASVVSTIRKLRSLRQKIIRVDFREGR